jgi:hypothetical protein
MTDRVNLIVKQKSPYVSVSVAATNYLFKSAQTVRRWCAEKRIPEFRNARKMGRDWQIPRTDLMLLVSKSMQPKE